MQKIISRLFASLMIVCSAGSAHALSIEPTSIPFSSQDAYGTFEFVGSAEDNTRLDFQVHVTSGRLDEIRLQIGEDPYYMASTTPGPDVDVRAVAGNLAMFFTMLGGVGTGESSDIFSATFPNGLAPGTFGEATFRRLDSQIFDTVQFTIVPEPSTAMMFGMGLTLLATRRGRGHRLG